MNVQVKDSLATVRVRIDHDAVAIFGKAFLAGDLGSGPK
jgi:hypothetical protein